ncbi:RNA polymerase sigma factor [Candidatus Poribacteria bacterium]
MKTADGYIVKKCINGDSAAFGLLVDRYKEGVYALAYSKLRNFHDAEDVAQEVFIKAYCSLRSLRRWDDFHAWIYSITANTCRDWIRAQSRRPDRSFIEDQVTNMVRDAFTDTHRENPLEDTLHEALDSLPEVYRKVLTLYYLGGMSSREIAEFLGMSPTTVRKRLSRARSQLKEGMLAMMGTTFEAQKLQAGFTFRVVEAAKRVKIQAMPRTAGLPWGLSLATGIMLVVLSLSPYLSFPNPAIPLKGASLPSETKVLKVGEIPVDMMKVSRIPLLAGEQGERNGTTPAPQNSFLLAPADDGGDEEAVRRLFDDFAAAYAASDLELMGKLWSREKDVRVIGTYAPGQNNEWVFQGQNLDVRGWDAIEHGYGLDFNIGHITAIFRNVDMQVQGNKASATFDAVRNGVSFEDGMVFFRKEDDEWRIHMLDYDGMEITRSGDEGSSYVELAFEAEDGKGVGGFLRTDGDASEGKYVAAEGRPLLEFDVPEAGEYTIWWRTYAPDWKLTYYDAEVDDTEFRGWSAICTKWTWSQLNEEGIKGQKLFKLGKGKHSIALSSPIVAGPAVPIGGCKLDAVYITNNLSLRADQIQRRFDIAMGYVKPQAVEARGKAITTWASIKRTDIGEHE